MYQERRLSCMGLDAPGNLCSDVSMLSFCNREYRFAVCVVLPERSRPSITINGARRVLLDIACQWYLYSSKATFSRIAQIFNSSLIQGRSDLEK